MSGIMIKTVDQGMRRRRRCDKHNLDLNRDQPDLIPNSDTYPVTPITPPAAFLSLGYKRPSTKGKGETRRKALQPWNDFSLELIHAAIKTAAKKFMSLNATNRN